MVSSFKCTIFVSQLMWFHGYQSMISRCNGQTSSRSRAWWEARATTHLSWSKHARDNNKFFITVLFTDSEIKIILTQQGPFQASSIINLLLSKLSSSILDRTGTEASGRGMPSSRGKTHDSIQPLLYSTDTVVTPVWMAGWVSSRHRSM